jgi:hypothetical protein
MIRLFIGENCLWGFNFGYLCCDYLKEGNNFLMFVTVLYLVSSLASSFLFLLIFENLFILFYPYYLNSNFSFHEVRHIFDVKPFFVNLIQITV